MLFKNTSSSISWSNTQPSYNQATQDKCEGERKNQKFLGFPSLLEGPISFPGSSCPSHVSLYPWELPKWLKTDFH